MIEIKGIIKADGSIEYAIKGVKGASCKDLTKDIDRLSDKVESKKTNEYYEAPKNNLTNKLGQ